MGANMARRLQECGYAIRAVYDSHRPLAEKLAAELGCAAPATLAEVTAAADLIFTVVTASSLSCLLPTVFLPSFTAAIAPVPPRTRNTARVDITFA